MSELELGSLLLHKYRIDGLRVVSRDMNVYDATDTLHERHVSIKVFEHASRFASAEHEGPVIDVGVVDGGAMFFVESASPMQRTSRPPPPLPRKPIAKTKSEPPPLPVPLAQAKSRPPPPLPKPSKPPPPKLSSKPPPPPKASKPPSVPPPPLLPKVIVEPDIEIDVDFETDDEDNEPTIDRRIHIEREIEIEIPIDFAKAVRGSKRPWWIAGIAAAAVIAFGVAWYAQPTPSNEASIETKTITPEITPAPTLEPSIVAPPPRPATTVDPPAVADPPPPADTSAHRHHRKLQPGEDPLTI